MALFVALISLLTCDFALAQDVIVAVPSTCTKAAIRGLVDKANLLPGATGAVLCSSWNKKYVIPTGILELDQLAGGYLAEAKGSHPHGHGAYHRNNVFTGNSMRFLYTLCRPWLSRERPQHLQSF